MNQSGMGSMARKRKSWQRDVALGEAAFASFEWKNSFHLRDIVTGRILDREELPSNRTVDGCSVTNQVDPLLGEGKDGEIGTLLRRAYLTAAPIMGSRWKRFRC